MFSGIIEATGVLTRLEKEGSNIHFTIASDISKESYIDQSISHNGVCLTVVRQDDDSHTVTAIKETLDKSNLGRLVIGDELNLERSIQLKTLLDGHLVQGHVDSTAKCIEIREENGSWYFKFEIDSAQSHLLVDKGSVAINGTSLTVVSPDNNTFEVAIIPYTYEHTNFKSLNQGDHVNIEFDIIGKYVQRYMDRIHNK